MDMTYVIGAKVIAAKLDINCNHSNSTCISSYLTAANSWLCSHPIGSHVNASSAAWQQIEPTSETLDKYENGQMCANQCN
jgi:hypothetical protein